MKKIYFYTLLLGLLAFTACEDEKSPVMELQKASAFEPFSQSDFTFNDENAAAVHLISGNSAAAFSSLKVKSL